MRVHIEHGFYCVTDENGAQWLAKGNNVWSLEGDRARLLNGRQHGSLILKIHQAIRKG
jgi:hypothetical protein